MASWDPGRYLRFSDLRTRPAIELLARVPNASPATVVDMGCGPGNSTSLLADRWPSAGVLGVDSSDAMLERARFDYPLISFVRGDVNYWEPDDPVDVLFANAVFQWIPDHLGVLPRLMGFLASGGSLAFQVPNNYDRPTHTEGHRIVRESFPDLDGILPDRVVFDASEHYDALAASGVVVDVWETTYLQPLTGEDPVVTWTSGTFLRPLLDALGDDPEREQIFLDQYAASMRRAYPPRSDGVTLLPFPRLFAVATRSG